MVKNHVPDAIRYGTEGGVFRRNSAATGLRPIGDRTSCVR